MVKHGITPAGKQLSVSRAPVRGCTFSWPIPLLVNRLSWQDRASICHAWARHARSAQVLHVSPTTVITELKERHRSCSESTDGVKASAQSRSSRDLSRRKVAQPHGLTSELDEMGGTYGRKPSRVAIACD